MVGIVDKNCILYTIYYKILTLRLAIPILKQANLQAQLDDLYKVRASQPELDISLFLESDFRLHHLFIRASGNGRLMRQLAALRSQQDVFQVRVKWYPKRVEIALDDHENFLLALIKQDTE